VRVAGLHVIAWSQGEAEPAAREGDCPRCGELLDDGKKPMRVSDALIRRRCLRSGYDHPYAPREEADRE